MTIVKHFHRVRPCLGETITLCITSTESLFGRKKSFNCSTVPRDQHLGKTIKLFITFTVSVFGIDHQIVQYFHKVNVWEKPSNCLTLPQGQCVGRDHLVLIIVTYVITLSVDRCKTFIIHIYLHIFKEKQFIKCILVLY